MINGMQQTLGGAINAIHALNQKVDTGGSTAARPGRLAEGAGSASMEAWNRAMQSAGQRPMEPSMRPAPMKPPAPARFRGVNKEPRILEWVHQAGQFLMSTGMTDSAQGVFHITNYLSDEAAVWELLTTLWLTHLYMRSNSCLRQESASLQQHWPRSTLSTWQALWLASLVACWVKGKWQGIIIASRKCAVGRSHLPLA